MPPLTDPTEGPTARPNNHNAVKVDCGSCSACCRRELVALIGGDDVSRFPEAVQVPDAVAAGVRQMLPTFQGFVIPHGDDGACIYLKEGRCSVYDRRPAMCRVFSCIGWVDRIMATTPRHERRRDKAHIDTAVWRAGMSRRKAALAKAGERPYHG